MFGVHIFESTGNFQDRIMGWVRGCFRNMEHRIYQAVFAKSSAPDFCPKWLQNGSLVLYTHRIFWCCMRCWQNEMWTFQRLVKAMCAHRIHVDFWGFGAKTCQNFFFTQANPYHCLFGSFHLGLIRTYFIN